MEGYVGGVDGSTIGAGTGYVREMVSLHWPNRFYRSMIAPSWSLQVTVVASAISQAIMDMTWMMQYCGVREGCARL